MLDQHLDDLSVDLARLTAVLDVHDQSLKGAPLNLRLLVRFNALLLHPRKLLVLAQKRYHQQRKLVHEDLALLLAQQLLIRDGHLAHLNQLPNAILAAQSLEQRNALD